MGLARHGHAKRSGVTRTYSAWQHMKKRCLDQKNKDYPNYGGRGIGVCSEWSSSYECFLAYMGEVPGGMSLDRINTNGNYEPGNCRWADAQTQSKNRRFRTITFDGISLTQKAWAEKLGLSPQAFHYRLRKMPNLPPEKVFSAEMMRHRTK